VWEKQRFWIIVRVCCLAALRRSLLSGSFERPCLLRSPLSRHNVALRATLLATAYAGASAALQAAAAVAGAPAPANSPTPSRGAAKSSGDRIADFILF
jgi:hypothetical protein